MAVGVLLALAITVAVSSAQYSQYASRSTATDATRTNPNYNPNFDNELRRKYGVADGAPSLGGRPPNGSAQARAPPAGAGGGGGRRRQPTTTTTTTTTTPMPMEGSYSNEENGDDYRNGGAEDAPSGPSNGGVSAADIQAQTTVQSARPTRPSVDGGRGGGGGGDGRATTGRRGMAVNELDDTLDGKINV